MKTRAVSVTVLALALAAVACGGAGTGGLPPTVEGQSALDAQATLVGWSAQQTAVAEETRAAARATTDAAYAIATATTAAYYAIATSTTAAHYATADAQAQAAADAQATVAAAAVASTATMSAVLADAQVVAVRLTAAAGEYALGTTATADAAILAFAQAEADSVIREQAIRATRREMWTRLTPWLVGAAVLTAVGVIFLLVGSEVLVRVRQSRPQRAGEAWVVPHREGPYVIPPPRPALSRVEPPRALLETGPVARPAPETFTVLPTGHMLIAGETDSGKSTAGRLVAAGRERVRVLDPHWNGRDWAGHQVIGAGRDFGAIAAFVEEMRGLLGERYQARAGGREVFEPVTVFVDEMPAIVAALGRDVRDFWREWLREGRKVGLFLVLLTQSTRVRTLGIEGEKDLLENFGTVLVLGKLARLEYPQLVEGMERPAVLHTLGAARPVVIPYGGPTAAPQPPSTPPAPPRGLEGIADVEPPSSATRPPIVYATTEWPLRTETAIDLDNLTAADRQRIIDEYRCSLVIRQVQLKLFPNYTDDGGKAGRLIREVLEEADMIRRDAGGRYQPTTRALGY